MWYLLSDDKQADVIDAFNTTSRYLDDILNIINVYFDNTVSQIYPSELQLNKANTSDTEAAFLDLHLSISSDIVLPKFMINVTTLILKLSISHFLMAMFLVLHPMESISLNSFVLLEHLAMLLTSTDRSKAVLLLWIFYVFVLSCVCYVFVRVCLYVLCGHLLGKD